MPIQLNRAIDTDTGERIIIYRRSGGDYVKGIWVEGTTKELKALASVQQPTKEEIELMTGLERDKDMKMFYANKTIVASSEFDDTEADIIKWKGRLYKAMKLGDWDSYGYNIAMGVRIE